MKPIRPSLYILILLMFLFFNRQVQGQTPKFLIPADSLIVDGDFAPYNTIQPGDTVFLQSGTRANLLLRDFFGNQDHPIVFINYGGRVTINTDFNYGIAIANCKFVHLTGTGDQDTVYGIDIQHVGNGAGVIISELSSDFEVDHIRIENVHTAGITAKTEPDCLFTSTRNNFTQFNTLIHDNYILTTGNEGITAGSWFYNGKSITCDGRDTVLYPSILSGVRVYNNTVTSAGWAGIQVNSASVDCRIYNNTVTNDSQAGDSVNISGIYLGPGTKSDCYNNTISEGQGNGIEDHGLGGNRLFNNLIVDAGRTYFPGDLTKKRHGILVNDVSTQPDSSFRILFNDIINPKCDGVRFESVISRNNFIVSNVIINPGDYVLEGMPSYIEIEDPASEVTISNNYLRLDTINAGFINGTYVQKAGSPLIDAGYYQGEGVTFDYTDNPRPIGAGFDIGIYEFNLETTGIQPIATASDAFRAYPNPARVKMNLDYELLSASDVILDIYNLEGEKLLTKVQTAVPAGNHVISQDIVALSSGIYMFRLRTGSKVITGKFIKTLN